LNGCAAGFGFVFTPAAGCRRAARETVDGEIARLISGSTMTRALPTICNTPAKRGRILKDIADAVVLFLTGSDFTTGQILAVDGDFPRNSVS
jgi:hypothetical protein